MQEFKSIQDLLKQDSTMEVFGYRDGDTGCLLPLSVEKLHEQVAAVALGPHVPPEIQSYFNTARNLFVFSYYHYGFIPVSAFLALSAVEMAVRMIYPWELEPNSAGKPDGRSFKSLLERAVKEGRLHEDGFPSLREARTKYRAIMLEFARSQEITITEKGLPYQEVFPAALTKLRNSFAHPGEMHMLLTPEMVFPQIQRSAEAINQLFADRTRATG